MRQSRQTITWRRQNQETRSCRLLFQFCLPSTILLIAAVEVLGVILNFNIFLASESLQDIFQSSRPQEITKRQLRSATPRTVYLDSSAHFEAHPVRPVDDIWLGGGRDKKYTRSSMVGILPGSVSLDGTTTQCMFAAPWQMRFYPTCNSFHELAFRMHPEEEMQHQSDEKLELLGSGKTRDAYRVVGPTKETFVLKTLQLRGQYSQSTYYQQTLDAIVNERLTSSKFVINTYGFCGASTFNELGISHQVKENFSFPEKLRFARDLAGGLADLHCIGGGNHSLVVHGDLRRGNVMFSNDKKTLKLSDFNLGFFLGWNARKQEPCGHKRDVSKRARLRDKFSAPEETFGLVLNEKTDVYHLGGMIFYLLTGGKPFIYNDSNDFDEKGNPKFAKKWVLPVLPKRLQGGHNPVIAPMWEATQACLHYKAQNRPTAREIYVKLNKALKRLENEKINS